VLSVAAAGGDATSGISSSEAVSVAVLAMGLDGMSDVWNKEVATSADLTTMVDSTTAFLSRDKRYAYEVRMKGVPVTCDTTDSGDRVVVLARDFSVFVDPETGTILAVVSTLPTYIERIRSGEIRRPTRDELEAHLESQGEKFTDVVCGKPSPPFLVALRSSISWQDADLIHGYYVTYESRAFGGRLAWIIETCGHIRMHGDTYTRTAVDETGLLHLTNAPVPKQ
jgi:hypothetical protein